jgi:hypothetical protein
MAKADPTIRFLLFQCDDYDALGGMEDCEGEYGTIEEARANAKVYDAGPILGKWTQHTIYDTWTGEFVPVIEK